MRPALTIAEEMTEAMELVERLEKMEKTLMQSFDGSEDERMQKRLKITQESLDRAYRALEDIAKRGV